MPGVELSIKLASDDPRWDQYDDATKAASAILVDCMDRRGIKGEFSRCDLDVIADIIDQWSGIIRTVQGDK